MMVELVSHGVATLAFLGLGLVLLWNRRPTGLRLAVVLASFLTAIWAGLRAYIAYTGNSIGFSFFANSETIRMAGWLTVLLILQHRSLGLREKPGSILTVAATLGFIVALQAGIGTAVSDATVLEGHSFIAQLFTGSRMLVAIAGLVLLHNLYVGANTRHSLSFRLLAVGLALIFVYDLNIYTLKFLLGHRNEALLSLRGTVNALAAPLIFMSIRHERPGRFMLSRRAAFQTASFAVIGLYLILMSLIAYGLRLTGGDWGPLLQAAFMAVTLSLGTLVLLSQRFRAKLRVLIAINFYRYRYDYRLEWLRFIETIDATGDSQSPFRERLIEAVVTVLESPGGALLEISPGEGFQPSATWGWNNLHIDNIDAQDPLLTFMAEAGRIINFNDLKEGVATRNQPAILKFPDWAEKVPDLWLAIPLIRRDELLGLLLLRQSFAPRSLNWEDYNLLRTLGRQSASYLAESAIQTRLDEARSFDEYHRRFAFVMHDLKNLVSQLSLLARNAERHADNPEFQKDMISTLQASVGKMSDLLRMVGRESGNLTNTGEAVEVVDLNDLLSTVAAAARRAYTNISVENSESSLPVKGEPGRLEYMFTHLVQNAVDASPNGKPITIRLNEGSAAANVQIEDQGTGMSASFIRNELFQPFHSTKEGGFGIGVFEAREIARAHGGDIQVRSTPEVGTTFSVVLPLVEDR